MSRVVVSNLTKNFDGKPPTVAVDDLDLVIEEGEFLVLLGPSGCGKTSTLRCIAGLETPDHGSLTIGSSQVFDSEARINLSPDRRSIGMVFQSYALWPHMSVRRNIDYPLKARKLGQLRRDGAVDKIAALVDCEGLLDRLPAELSGGQQQRVALARGLVAEPDLVLFDEPLSNLDARLRDHVRAELHNLHRTKPFTAVFVTHDQVEALALATKTAVMRAGRVEQFGEPQDVYERPATDYVAEFIGMLNRFEVAHYDGCWRMPDSFNFDEEFRFLDPSLGTVGIRVRPEHLSIKHAPEDLTAGEVAVRADVVDAEYGGGHLDVTLRRDTDPDGVTLRARVPVRDERGELQLQPGGSVLLAFRVDDARFFDASGRLLKVGSDMAVEDRALGAQL